MFKQWFKHFLLITLLCNFNCSDFRLFAPLIAFRVLLKSQLHKFMRITSEVSVKALWAFYLISTTLSKTVPELSTDKILLKRTFVNCGDMGIQMAFLSKTMTANITKVWLFLLMHWFNMSIQAFHIIKWITAKVTNLWFLLAFLLIIRSIVQRCFHVNR